MLFLLLFTQLKMDLTTIIYYFLRDYVPQKGF